jgi:hypothetical protein
MNGFGPVKLQGPERDRQGTKLGPGRYRQGTKVAAPWRPSFKDAGDGGRVAGQPLLGSALGAPPRDRTNSETAPDRDDYSNQDVRQSRPQAGVPPTPGQHENGPWCAPSTTPLIHMKRRLPKARTSSQCPAHLLSRSICSLASSLGMAIQAMWGHENRGPHWTAPCQNWLPGPDSNQRPTG